MGRREYHGNWPCGEAGCRERARFVYDLQRDYAEAGRRYAKDPWRCTRHTDPESVLGLDRLSIQATATASRVKFSGYEAALARYVPGGWGSPPKEYLDGLFWVGAGMSSGFTFGPGFKAFADDFPEGTKLVITVEAVLPDAHS